MGGSDNVPWILRFEHLPNNVLTVSGERGERND